jgi:hypothetical protein
MASSEVLGVASASLAGAISGSPPTCTAFLSEWQVNNCDFAPAAEILGLDSLFLQFDFVGETHLLAMDEVIEHCGGACSTEWHHMAGAGSLSVVLPAVPVPAAAWLFGSALGMLGWLRRLGPLGGTN